MPGFTRRVFIVVAAGARPLLRTRFAQVDPDGANGSFISPLSVTGNAPATHYAASGQITEQQFTKLQTAITGLSSVSVWEYDLDTDPGFPSRQVESLGLRWILD